MRQLLAFPERQTNLHQSSWAYNAENVVPYLVRPQMRLLVLDDPDGGSALDLAIRAQRDGHQVKVAIKPKDKSSLIGKGFVEVVDDPRPWYRWANLIVACHNTWHIHSLDAHRKEGGKIIAASVETAQWESNRRSGRRCCASPGLPRCRARNSPTTMPQSRTSKSTNKRYVSKPTGDGAADADKALSYVIRPGPIWSYAGAMEAAAKLKTAAHPAGVRARRGNGRGGMVRSRRLERGLGRNFEFKKLMNDDLGPRLASKETFVGMCGRPSWPARS